MKRGDLCPELRNTARKLPDPYANHYGVIPPPPPETGIRLGALLPRVQAGRQALARVNAIAEELKDPYLISRTLTRREAVSSSTIEGTRSTLDELLLVEEQGDDAARVEARQVRDYAQVLETLLPQARRQGNAIFTQALIQDLHRAVMRDVPDYADPPGALRQRVVWIGGVNINHSTYNPPPPDAVADCLTETIDYLGNTGLQATHQDVLIRMAVAHSHFEAVHPFRDGNGRVGRLLLPLMMAADGQVPLYLSPGIEAHKDRYFASLKAAQQQLHWAEMVAFLADIVVETVDELMATRAALAALRESWVGRRRFRKGSAALTALDVLPHYPIVTVRRLGDLLDISGPQAAMALKQLQDAGIVAEKTGYVRNRIFVATEALAIINRPFGADVPG
ncbi:Fic family protein [Azospirillum sp. B4]|uniref:Fic family protein n=1 Tax=Azospirillum sp. B4 TaxID=95605 RepID=UPI000348A9BB|nr:Fic family protein [Azospirillum sp. B4]